MITFAADYILSSNTTKVVDAWDQQRYPVAPALLALRSFSDESPSASCAPVSWFARPVRPSTRDQHMVGVVALVSIGIDPGVHLGSSAAGLLNQRCEAGLLGLFCIFLGAL